MNLFGDRVDRVPEAHFGVVGDHDLATVARHGCGRVARDADDVCSVSAAEAPDQGARESAGDRVVEVERAPVRDLPAAIERHQRVEARALPGDRLADALQLVTQLFERVGVCLLHRGWHRLATLAILVEVDERGSAPVDLDQRCSAGERHAAGAVWVEPVGLDPALEQLVARHALGSSRRAHAAEGRCRHRRRSPSTAAPRRRRVASGNASRQKRCTAYPREPARAEGEDALGSRRPDAGTSTRCAC